MSKRFQEFQMEVQTLQEKIDSMDLSEKALTPEKFDALHKELQSLEKHLDTFQKTPEHSAISYRLQIQHYKGILKQLSTNLQSLKPKLNIPVDKPLSGEDLYKYYVQAQQFHQKDDGLTIDEAQFTEALKKARFKARHYYEGAKTQACIDLDDQGPYIKIKRRIA